MKQEFFNNSSILAVIASIGGVIFYLIKNPNVVYAWIDLFKRRKLDQVNYFIELKTALEQMNKQNSDFGSLLEKKLNEEIFKEICSALVGEKINKRLCGCVLRLQEIYNEYSLYDILSIVQYIKNDGQTLDCEKNENNEDFKKIIEEKFSMPRRHIIFYYTVKAIVFFVFFIVIVNFAVSIFSSIGEFFASLVVLLIVTGGIFAFYYLADLQKIQTAIHFMKKYKSKEYNIYKKYIGVGWCLGVVISIIVIFLIIVGG